jgi:hypothetical protein
MKKMLFSITAVLLFAVAVFAVDPGVPDTIIYQRAVYVPYNPGNWMTAYINAYFVTDDSVANIILPTRWNSTDGQIFADSIIWGSLLMQWDDYWSQINRDTSIIHILGFSDLGGADNPVLYTNLERLMAFTIRFKISPTAAPQVVIIDTTRDRRMGSATFGLVGGGGGDDFSPIISTGSIYYGVTSDVGSAEVIPSEYLLAQNYPNPFNPITQISFEVPTAANVNVEVYNILGQKIKTLVSEYKDAGQYTVSWNATNENGQPVPSGVYFYRLKTDNYSETKRMMLLK